MKITASLFSQICELHPPGAMPLVLNLPSLKRENGARKVIFVCVKSLHTGLIKLGSGTEAHEVRLYCGAGPGISGMETGEQAHVAEGQGKVLVRESPLDLVFPSAAQVACTHLVLAFPGSLQLQDPGLPASPAPRAPNTQRAPGCVSSAADTGAPRSRQGQVDGR